MIPRAKEFVNMIKINSQTGCLKLAILFITIFCSQLLNGQQNTILIIADDVSPDYFGCYSNAMDTANTPVVSELAKNGVMFTKVWASPVCSSTRAGILTGKYPFRTGIGGVITGPASPQIDTSEMSIAKLLKYYAPATYNTACIGKWHLNNNGPPKRLIPNRLGFDLYSGNFNGAISDYYSYQRVKNGIIDTVNAYATSQTVNDAIDWIDTMNTSNPFFLWLAFNAPHTPFHLPPASLCNTTGLSGTASDITANPKKYFKAAIEAMDTEIGRLFDHLTTNNLMDSTNIIFIGDNGNASQVAQITSTNKAKGTIYNYGVHVPMIVAGPAVVNGDRTSDELINTPDLFATITELSGFPNWSNYIPAGTILDSRSFLPILKDQITINRTWIFSETFNSPSTFRDGKTIRNQDYQLLRFDNGDEEFYNQTIDFEEDDNLLLNTSGMTLADVSNYHFLCDSISVLTGATGCLPISIVETHFQNEISIYPNPGSDLISVDLHESINKSIRVSVVNILGEKVASYMLSNKKNTIDISSFPSGVYYLLLEYNESARAKKIIKK